MEEANVSPNLENPEIPRKKLKAKRAVDSEKN